MSADKLGPIEIEFLLDKQADEQARKLKASLDDVGASVKKNTTNFKQEIQNQKEIIKGLTAEIKDMQKTFDNATAGVKKNDLGKELGQAKRRLGEAQTDLIRLQKEQIEVNNKEKESADSLTGQIGKWALSIGGAAAILGTLKNALLETTGGLNVFNIASAVTKQALYDIVSGAGLSIEKLMSAMTLQKQLNELRIEGYITSYKAAELEAEYQKAYSESLDASLSVPDKLKKIDEALAKHTEAIKIQQLQVVQQIKVVKDQFNDQPDNETFKKQLAELYTQFEALGREAYESTKRLVRQKSVLIEDGEKKDREEYKKTVDLIKKAADEQIEIDNSISEQAKLLQKAVDDGNIAEIKAIADRIKLLQEEQRIRENIAKAALLAAYGGDITKVTHIPNAPTLATSLPALPGLQEASTQAQAGAANAAAKQWNIDDANNDERKLKNKKELLRLTIELTSELGKQGGMDDKVIQGFDSFAKLVSGDYFGAAAGMLSSLISMIPNEASKFAEQINTINNLIKEQQRLIDQSSRTGGGAQAREDYIKLLEQKQRDLFKQLNYAVTQGKPTAQILADFQEVQDEIDSAKQDLKDFLSGGITENTIADTIAQGFQDGKTSVDDFAGYMDDVLRNALLNIFKEEILDSPEMKAYITYIQEALSDKILTPEEKAKIDQMGSQLETDMKPAWDLINQTGIFNKTDASASQTNNSLVGAVKGVTEETASVLAGQINAIRMSQATATNVIQSSLKQLMIISDNTSYCIYLKSIDERLSDISKSNSLRPQGIA
jgi:hypothetical protein